MILPLTSTTSQESMSDGEFWITTFIIAGLVMLPFIIRKKIKENRGKRKEKKARALALAELEEKRQKYISMTSIIHSRYGLGISDKTISVSEYEIQNEVKVFAKEKKLMVSGIPYDFSKIVSANFTDEATQRRGDARFDTEGTSKAASFGVGSFAGKGGMGVGSSSAKVTSHGRIRYDEDIISHNYTVWINIKDVLHPLIEVPVGDNQRIAMEIVSVVNAIAADNVTSLN